VALVSLGEATASHPDFHVGLNLAGVFRAPLVLLCRSRRGPALEGLPRQGAVEVASRAVAYGVEAARVAGWDLLAVRQAVGEAVERARAGGGATLVEAITWHEDGRAPARGERDPVRLLRRHLEGRGIWDPGREEALWRSAREEASRAVASAAGRRCASTEALLDGVYGSAPPHLREQKAEVRAQAPAGGEE
jgi:TPP-dependent pyruvate/acetoin dehydrogenase alpha subunit